MTDLSERAVGERLRVLQIELGYKTTREFAAFLGAERGTVDAWLNGRAFPPVRFLTPLRDQYGITLDWIFYNDPTGLPYARSIRLQAALAGEDVPPVEAGVKEVPTVETQPAASPHRRKRSRAATS